MRRTFQYQPYNPYRAYGYGLLSSLLCFFGGCATTFFLAQGDVPGIRINMLKRDRIAEQRGYERAKAEVREVSDNEQPSPAPEGI